MATSKSFSSKFGNSGGLFFAKVLCFVLLWIVFVAAM
jgi:hypothetical protein